MTDKQALRLRNYLDTAHKSGVKLLHLSSDELEGLLNELEAKDKLNAELMEKQRLIDICQGQGLEHRIAAEKRAEAAESRIAELEARTITVKFEPIPMEELGNRRDGKKHPYMFGAGYNSAVVHCESVMHQACAAAGIGVKGE